MGQKVNPIIFRITNTSWTSKYFDKKTTELSVYTKKDVEIRDFIYRFFDKNKIRVYNCNISYLEKSIHIFVSYFNKFKLKTLDFPLIKNNQIKWFQKHKSKIENYLNKSKKNSQKITLSIKRFFEIETMTFILEQFFESIANFTNWNLKIFLVLQKLNHRGKYLQKKNKMRLRKYKTETYYKEGIKIFFTCGTNKESAKQLSKFLAFQLKYLKRHNRFFKFIKETLSLIKQSKIAMFERMKIQIKGRINGRPRARKKVITIGNNVSVFKISSSIFYGESFSFTSNGTLGVKVWIQKKEKKKEFLF